MKASPQTAEVWLPGRSTTEKSSERVNLVLLDTAADTEEVEPHWEISKVAGSPHRWRLPIVTSL